MPILQQAEGADARARDVRFDDDRFTVELMDGRAISAPIAFFPRLLNGSREQRSRWELIGTGQGIHWPELDEDISTEGLLRGARAPGQRSG